MHAAMLKLTRLDQRTVAINPDHIAWVEATPDTTLCLVGDRKVIVRESLDEVCERFIAARTRMGCASPIAVHSSPPSHRRPSVPSGAYTASGFPPAPQIIDEPDRPADSVGYRGTRPSGRPEGGE